MGEPAEILETTKVQRNDAIRFAALTLVNLEFIEAAWRTARITTAIQRFTWSRRR